MEARDVPARLSSLPSWLLTQVAARAGRLIAERATEAGAAKAAFPILAALDEFGALSQAEVGRRVGIDRKDISGYAAGLERAGLVRRGPDPADVRRNQLEITPAGRELLGRLDATFGAAQEELLATLSPEDRAELTRLLTLLAR